jgi:transposase
MTGILPEKPGVLSMKAIAEIRRRHFLNGESIRALAREFKHSRNTISKHLATIEEPVYQREHQPLPALGDYVRQLTSWLEHDIKLPRRQRRTSQRLFECLQVEGYAGSYSPVQRYVKAWKSSGGHLAAPSSVFVPLSFPAGETCQFDWSYEHVVLSGVLHRVKVAHFRLCYSRKMFIIAYPRETQEMVLDAHVRAFTAFGGAPKRMVYDNLKTVVEAIFAGKARQFNRRFLALANHYLFEPVACTPESGWEKGQIENQVGNVREWLFTPTPRFADYAELNVWLAKRCEELTGRKHPEQIGRTIADCFAEEQPLLIPVKADFDGYIEKTMRVTSTCLLKVDHNRYSVPADWANRIVSVRTTANSVKIVADNQVVAEHSRSYGRGQLICDPWHYLPVLAKKPGALRHGAPFRQWELPTAISVVRDRLLKQDKGDRAFVELLLMARALGQPGLEILEVACDLTLQTGVVAAAIVLNEMRRLSESVRPKTLTGTALSVPTLQIEPKADCGRYDSLREPRYAH